MEENVRTVTLNGNPLPLAGSELRVGQPAPNFALLANDLTAIKLSDFAGKVLVISTVPSLDTPTCDLETRRFNQEAASLSDDVRIITVSTDLPFAQIRWCVAAEVEDVLILSDHIDALFGLSYGVLIPGLRLLARVVFVVDPEGVIRYIQRVEELSEEPDYDAVIAAVKDCLA